MASDNVEKLQGSVPTGMDGEKLRAGVQIKKQKIVGKALFLILAAATFLAAAVLGVGGMFVVIRHPAASLLRVTLWVLVVVALVGAGIGLLYLRKWAAITVSLLFLVAAKWELQSAIHPIPGYANWLGFLFAMVLATPLLVTVAYWHALTWSGGSSPIRDSDDAEP